MIFDAQRAVGLNLLGSRKDVGQRALSDPVLGVLPSPGDHRDFDTGPISRIKPHRRTPTRGSSE